jgi:hypothetical protein
MAGSCTHVEFFKAQSAWALALTVEGLLIVA